MKRIYTAEAIVTEDGQLRLDERISLPPGRVLVRVETIASTPAPTVQALDLAGRSGLERTREDVDAQVLALRAEWGA